MERHYNTYYSPFCFQYFQGSAHNGRNIIGTRINIKFWRSKLGLEIKRSAQWIQIKY